MRRVALALRPFLDAVDVEGVHAAPGDDGAFVARHLARGARRVEEVAADPARVVVGPRNRAVPRPAPHKVHGLDLRVHGTC